jgi:hypothetical protein
MARICRAQRVEHHDLVDAVDELGAEVRLTTLHHRRLHALVVLLAGQLLDHVRAEVRGHDDDGVAEIHRAALAVGQAAVVQHLQQHVEHVRVRLLDLVEQHHRVGLAAHRLGQVAALLVADVARRRADQARHRVLFHELGHVDAHHRSSAVEQELGQRLAQLGLADAGGPQEQEGAVRAIRIGQAGARARMALATAFTASSWPTTRLCSASSMRSSLSRSPSSILRDRDAGPLGDHLGDLLLGDRLRSSWSPAALGGAWQRQLLLQLRDAAVLELGHAAPDPRARAAPIEARLLELLLDLCWRPAGRPSRPSRSPPGRRIPLELGELVLQVGQALRLDASSFSFFSASRSILSWMSAPSRRSISSGLESISMRMRRPPRRSGRWPCPAAGGRRCSGGQRGRRDDGRIGDLDAVVHLVALLQAAQDGDGVLHRGLVRPAPSGSGAPARRPSPRTCGIRRAWWRRRSAARRAPARA